MKFLSSLIIFSLLNSNFIKLINVNHKFYVINKKILKFNAIEAKLAWDLSVNPLNPVLFEMVADHQNKRIKWRHKTCETLVNLDNQQLLNETQRRQAYLLCRGTKYTLEEARVTSYIYGKLQTLYSDAQICIPISKHMSIRNLHKAEAAILDYLSTVKYFSHINQKVPAANSKVNVDRIHVQESFCLEGEGDFEKLMKFSKNEEVLEWLWLVWRQEVSARMRHIYEDLFQIEKYAARRNGYLDYGATWRDELEIPELRRLCHHLYSEIRPLYEILHGVVRFYLRRHYGDIVMERGPIPAHLLGSLWSQNWESIIDLITPITIDFDKTKNYIINKSIKDLSKSVVYLVKRVEDFYHSLGLPTMTNSFWYESVFMSEIDQPSETDLSQPSDTDPQASETAIKSCLRTAAADMFKRGDFRLLYCSGTSLDDFYVLHHELGYIQYFMAYENQPAIFRQADTTLYETIGDTIMYGVLTPQHLNRLGLINDSLLYTDVTTVLPTYRNTRLKPGNVTIKTKRDLTATLLKLTNKKKVHQDSTTQYYDVTETYKTWPERKIYFNIDDFATTAKVEYDKELKDITIDEILMLKLALNKIPQIPFSLLIDEYRYKYFGGGIDEGTVNKVFWKMALKLLGIAPPAKMEETFFDVGTKFHVPDNTVYIRYFLSSFLQHQLFEVLCKASVFGYHGVQEPLPKTMTMNRCDIYGSKAAGKILKDLMSRGNSQNWREILQETTGIDKITASALKRYYRPLSKLLKKLVRIHKIPIGW